MSARYASLSDLGQRRENNEDVACVDEELNAFVVADGMGGHVGGEIASRVAVDAWLEEIRARPTPKRARDEGPLLRAAVLAANRAVVEQAESRGLHGMGTTLTGLRFHGRTAIIAHVGDSRAYAITAHNIRTLTRDQTVVERMLQRGEITAAEARGHPEAHVLTQALGSRELIIPEIVQSTLRRGTRVLLCSDGLHDMLDDREIARLAFTEDMNQAVNDLVERANALGAPDNITVLLVESGGVLSVRFDAVVFDLDGTLWDAAEASATGWTKAGRAHGLDRTITAEAIGGVCGLPFDECVTRLFPERCGPDFAEFLADLSRCERDAVIEFGGRLYAGVEEGLARLAERAPLHLLSNCDRWYLDVFFEHFDLRRYFLSAHCYGDNELPKAENLKRIAAQHQLSTPAYVGDTAGDRDATRKAGWNFLYADWGFDSLDEKPAFANFAALEEHLRARL